MDGEGKGKYDWRPLKGDFVAKKKANDISSSIKALGLATRADSD